MSDVMVIVGNEVENRFMSAMERGIGWVQDTSQVLKNFFSYAAEECAIRGENIYAHLTNPHASHAPEAHSAHAHSSAAHDEKAHESFGGWLDWRANVNKQEGWAVHVNELMRKAGGAFSYFNLPSFFPKRPSTQAIHARPFTEGARPQV